MNKYGIAMFRLKEVVLIDTKMMSLKIKQITVHIIAIHNHLYS